MHVPKFLLEILATLVFVASSDQAVFAEEIHVLPNFILLITCVNISQFSVLYKSII